MTQQRLGVVDPGDEVDVLDESMAEKTAMLAKTITQFARITNRQELQDFRAKRMKFDRSISPRRQPSQFQQGFPNQPQNAGPPARHPQQIGGPPQAQGGVPQQGVPPPQGQGQAQAQGQLPPQQQVPPQQQQQQPRGRQARAMQVQQQGGPPQGGLQGQEDALDEADSGCMYN